MNYLNIETVQLFIYFLFFDWGNKPKDFISFSEEDKFYPDIFNFNVVVQEDIINNGLEDIFNLGNRKNKDSSVFICLLNEPKLRNFLKIYTDNFAADRLNGDLNIFPFDIQLLHLNKELSFYEQKYNNKPVITAIPRAEENSKTTISCGLKAFEFLLYLYFHKNQYVKIHNCNRIYCSDAYLHLKDKFLNIALEVEFTKPVDEIFEELRIELGISETEPKPLSIDYNQIIEIDGLKFNPNNKRVHKNGNEIKFKSINSKNFKLAEFLIKNPDRVHKIKDFYNNILNDEYFDFDFRCFKRIVFDLNTKLGLEEKTSPFINILGQTEFILNTSKVLSSNVTET